MKIDRYIVQWARVLFGAHSLISGLNHFFVFVLEPKPNHPIAGPFVDSMTRMGLFDVIKVVEVLVGVSLLVNRGVLLALVMELPTSVSIFWLSVVVVHSDRSLFTGTKELFLNIFLLAAYGRYYLPLLNWKPEPNPIWSGARPQPGGAANG